MERLFSEENLIIPALFELYFIVFDVWESLIFIFDKVPVKYLNGLRFPSKLAPNVTGTSNGLESIEERSNNFVSNPSLKLI